MPATPDALGVGRCEGVQGPSPALVGASDEEVV